MIVGGALMVLSTVLFLVNLFLTHRNGAEQADRSMAYAETVEPVVRVPALLNGFAVWNWLLVALMAIAWAYPIGQFFLIGVHKSLGWGVR
jgi:cytochrome c oxidase subunit 1